MALGVQLALPCTAMALDHPLPFRLKIPGEDTLDWRGVRSISYRLDGLLHVVGDVITFEWAATRHTQRVSLTGVKDEVDESPVGAVQVPLRCITRAQVRGGWWTPRLQLWARRIDAFHGVPARECSPSVSAVTIETRQRPSPRPLSVCGSRRHPLETEVLLEIHVRCGHCLGSRNRRGLCDCPVPSEPRK
jgi:hypothetical protein